MNQNGHIKDIRVGKTQSFIRIRIKFLIQLVIVRTIYHFLGLSLGELVFDSTNVKKYELTYITLFHIQTNNKINLLTSLQHENTYDLNSIHPSTNFFIIIIM